MIKRDDASRLREEFWTTFGKYMNPVPSSEGLKINWINYRTTFKDVYFRMDASQDVAIISISLEHKDEGMRELYFQQLEEFKTVLHATLGEEWNWKSNVQVAGQREVSRVYKEMHGYSIYSKEHWPELISFFKPRIIALDRFWEDARFGFEALR